MPSSNCCCLTFIQISQEAGKVVWYFHLFKNFPQSVVIHIIKGIGMVKTLGFLHSSVGKESACNAGELGLIPGLGRFPGEGNGNPLQHSCLENPMDRRAWRATIHRVAKSRTRLKWFSTAPHNLEIIQVVVWWLVITLQISSLKTWTLFYLPVSLRYLVTAQLITAK